MTCKKCELEKYAIDANNKFSSRVLQILSDMTSEGSAPFDPKRAKDIIINVLLEDYKTREKMYKTSINEETAGKNYRLVQFLKERRMELLQLKNRIK